MVQDRPTIPTVCRDQSLVIISDTCYALGGKDPLRLNQVHYASIDDLLGKAVPANQTTHSGSSVNTQSDWKTLANTPTYGPAAVMLHAIGGEETSNSLFGADKKEVYMFSISTESWVYICDLPEPRSDTAVAVLSPTEILVIGGWFGHGGVKTTYKGTLSITRFDYWQE